MTDHKNFMLEPHSDRLYIELDEIPESAGLIALPRGHAEPTRIATILAVGPETAPYVVGDRIAIESASGTNLYLWYYGIKDEKRRVITRSNILGKVIGG